MHQSDWENNLKYNIRTILKIPEKCFAVLRTEYVAVKNDWIKIKRLY
jgi:hypothetical protein